VHAAIRRRTANDLTHMAALSAMFAEAFDDPASYAQHPPSEAYLRRLLGGDSFIPLVALYDGTVVGGLAAEELRKFEQERSEIYNLRSRGAGLTPSPGNRDRPD
jgi:aminoglycoside 3-N-acetyltransferase I